MKDGLQKTVFYTILGIVIMTALMTVTSITTPIEGVYIQLAYGYLALFAGTAVKRAGLMGLQRTIRNLRSNFDRTEQDCDE